MNQIQYTSMDTILARVGRELRGTDIHETDIIEWAGEALGFLTVAETLQEHIAFLEVKNHSVDVPYGFKYVLQVAKHNGEVYTESPAEVVDHIVNPEGNDEIIKNCVITDCQGKILNEEYDIAYYRPYFDLKFEYQGWMNSSYYKNTFSPVHLSNHTFLKSIVCEELNPLVKQLYNNCRDLEYTFVGDYPDSQLRFNFKEGTIALAYLKTAMDEENGYPLIPDDSSHLAAVTYYVKWKLAERLKWMGREGFRAEAEDNERKWNKYVRQANNKAKMPQGVDQYQNLMNESMYLIPRFRKPNGFFGNLGKEEDGRFKNPDNNRVRNGSRRYY